MLQLVGAALRGDGGGHMAAAAVAEQRFSVGKGSQHQTVVMGEHGCGGGLAGEGTQEDVQNVSAYTKAGAIAALTRLRARGPR